MTRKQAGFSTMELMIAIVVLAIAVIGASLVPALSLGRGTESNTYAANVAREVLDSYRAAWLNRADFKAESKPSTPSNLRFGCQVNPVPTVQSYVFDSAYDLKAAASADAVMRKVTVSVKCNRGVEATLSTLIGDPEPGKK